MIRKLLFNNYQKKIDRLTPPVAIRLNKELPTPAAQEIVHFAKTVSKVNALENEVKDKPDSFFKEKTEEFKALLKERTGAAEEDESLAVIEATLEEILPLYFAMVREAARRTIRMRHFDTQILGGIILHKHKIAEMATGEGKTLVATLAASLNALVARGVHIVTVNDYLAKRDWEWMGPVYRFLGFTVGVVQQDMDKQMRKNAYACDITYGTNNEFGFDYLRDNMTGSLDEMVQGPHFYAIVDEIDSILIDEARTPLIISGPAEVFVEKYYQADRVARTLNTKFVISSHDTKEGTVIIKNIDGSEATFERDQIEDAFDAIVEEKTHNAYLTKRGEKTCERLLGIKSISEETPDKFSNTWVHYLTNALKGHFLFKRDKDYIVKDQRVIIVDEFTGRLMPGRRWSEGIHQAIEAKERIRIQQESQTLATVTLQNYFRMYDKLSGMTGTAYTEANEFRHIYKLDVVSIPTNRPLIRTSYPDRIYKTKKAKFNAIVLEIEELYKDKRPVLVGTTSIDDSEHLSFLLNKKGIQHNVLNAKYHEKEAHIVAQAGKLGQVTIATNMAGRGTDIILGGNIDFFIKEKLFADNITPSDERFDAAYSTLYDKYKDAFLKEHEAVVSLGGLHLIGSQRHEARRIDNQLKGRAGRQGDPGSSRFYISLEDDIMRLFGSERIYMVMDRLGFPEDEPIEHAIVTHSIEVAQKRVEAHNFEIRKNLLQFDDVMNRQRETIYTQRRELLEKDSIKDEIFDMIDDTVDSNVPVYFSDEPDYGALAHWAKSTFGLELDQDAIAQQNADQTAVFLKEQIKRIYHAKEESLGAHNMRAIEKIIALSIIDSRWKDHLLVIDSLKEGISLRSYAHVDPVIEYQKESYMAFSDMISSIKGAIVELVLKTTITPQREMRTVFSETPKRFVHSQYSSLRTQEKKPQQPATPGKPSGKKVGRNEPCPCGSGKKYKKCCGR